MFVAPRPRAEDDPLFAVRLAIGAVLAFIAAMVLRPSMPMLAPALTVGIMGGMRLAFDPKKAVGGPVAMAVIMSLMAFLVEMLRPFPMALVFGVGAIYTVSYAWILRSGHPLGMLVLVATALMSIMGFSSIDGMIFVRDAFVEGAGVTLCVVRLLYVLLPPAASERAVEHYPAGLGGRFLLRGAIRGGVLLLLTFWLYTVADRSNLMLAVAAIFVMVFPTRAQQWAEARERIFSTVLGGAMALVVLGSATLTAHLINVMLMVLLASLVLGDRMLHGRQPPMVYQFALSSMIAVVGAALTTGAPLDTTVLRIVLTMAGTVVAALLTSLIEDILLSNTRSCCLAS